MLNIGICDDGREICAAMEEQILRYAKEKGITVETKVWYTGEGLCDYVRQGGIVDILFLDIELFQMSGIEAAGFIRERLEDRRMQIIYISGKASYALQLFKTQPLDFLIKPVSEEAVFEALTLAVKILQRDTEKFEYRNGRDYYYISCGEILYFASEGRKIKIMTLRGEKEFYGKMKDLSGRLPEGFLIIHQSYAVNKAHVLRYTYETVELTDGTVLTISKAHRRQVRENLLREM